MKKLDLLKTIVYFIVPILFFGSLQTKAQFRGPEDLVFRRQAVKRIVFDNSQRITLSELNPANIVGFDVMHPIVDIKKYDAEMTIEEGQLVIKASEASATRLIGAFNVFATYDLEISSFSGIGEIGMIFRDSEAENFISAHLICSESKYQSIRCNIIKEGQILETFEFDLPNEINLNAPLTLRAQMVAVGANIYIEQYGKTNLMGRFDFVHHFDLRKQELMRQFEFCLNVSTENYARIKIKSASGYVSPGIGQGDMRIVTYEDGSAYFYNERLWILITVRGGGLPHPMQGVYSLNPSVFDIQFEGIILYDRKDGLLRNDLASNIFYDRNAKEWRGFTTGFSSYGDPEKKENKEILAVQSSQMPLQGSSVMEAKSIGLIADFEDPQCIYDKSAGKWRMLLCENHKGYKAVLREADTWDGNYKRIAGPVEVNSTGTQLQKFGERYYALFGSSARTIFVYSYPDLQPVGELNIHRPPWNDTLNTRIWPNVILLPEGYPTPYIALMMDRNNFPGMTGNNWTYGAMYLYHGFFKAPY